MYNNIYRYLTITPTILLGLTFFSDNSVDKSAYAQMISSNQPTINQINNPKKDNTMKQINSVFQLRDVYSDDWAYKALASLVERYGCVIGYPDRTYRGRRAMSRYEFAAGLNSCLQVIERLLAESEAILAEDMDLLKRLLKEFENELLMIGARVDNLEARVAFLEDHQFSTTTKLKGEVLLAFVAVGDDEQIKENTRYQGVSSPEDYELSDKEPTISNRVRLTLDSSFSGKDRLRIRLAAGNTPQLGRALGTDMASLNFEQNTENDVIVDRAYYRTSITDYTTVFIGTGLPPQDIYNTYNPFLKSDGTGALARFNRFNPFIYRQPGNTGFAAKFEVTDWFDITTSYLAAGANDPSEGNGLFNGSYSTGVQFGFNATDTFEVGLAYMHSYFKEGRVNLTGSTGSVFTDSVSQGISNEFLNSDGSRKGGYRGARDPFSGAATTSHNVGLQASWLITDTFNVAGWFGWSNATAHSHDSTGINRRNDNADMVTWNLNFSILDLGKEGAVFSVAGGQVPRIGDVDGTFGRDRQQPWIAEAQYKFPINDNISITPGIYAVFRSNSNIKGENSIVGIFRSVFKF